MATGGIYAEPTELAGVAEAPTESAYAWALDYDDYEVAARRFTPRRITDAALAGCLVLIALAGVVAVLGIRGVWHVEPVIVAAQESAPTTVVPTPTTEPAAAPTPVVAAPIIPTKTVTVAAPPPVTMQALPPTVPPSQTVYVPIPPTVNYDNQLIANLQARGWVVWDRPLVLQQAHWVCALLQDGENGAGAAQQLTGYPAADAQTLVATVMMTYPNCP